MLIPFLSHDQRLLQLVTGEPSGHEWREREQEGRSKHREGRQRSSRAMWASSTTQAHRVIPETACCRNAYWFAEGIRRGWPCSCRSLDYRRGDWIYTQGRSAQFGVNASQVHTQVVTYKNCDLIRVVLWSLVLIAGSVCFVVYACIITISMCVLTPTQLE